MARKLDARAASFSPVGAPSLQQEHAESTGAAARSSHGGGGGGGGDGAEGSSKERLGQGQESSPPSAEGVREAQLLATRGGDGQDTGDRNIDGSSGSNRPHTAATSQQANGGRRGGGSRRAEGGGGRGGGSRRQKGSPRDDETAHGAVCKTLNRSSNAEKSRRRSGNDARVRDGGGVVVPSDSAAAVASVSSSKGRGKGGNVKCGNANHLLNFQFQPISSASRHGDVIGGKIRRGSGGGGASGRSKGVGVWGSGSARGPMSKEQFLQANYHFLLHNPAWAKDDAPSSPAGLQEAFFDPDVLVDWDTVDTVRLFRKISTRKEAPLPTAGKHAADSTSSTAPRTAPLKRPTDHASRTSPGGAPREEPAPAPCVAVSPAVGEVSWGSGITRRDDATAAGVDLKGQVPRVNGTATAQHEFVGERAAEVSEVNTAGNGAPSGMIVDLKEGDEDDEGGWTCPICLGMPIAPRVTKCGHGPFCLVCILRHLKGETSARCPLCFDKMHRDQLRRVACQSVRAFTPGGKASFLLLQRERTSLVPTICSSAGEPVEYLDGVGCVGEESWAAGVCPKEGDESERFSRLVRANPSTLRDLVASEQSALLSFRHESIRSGETEWVPYVSQAQALVDSQLEHFSSLPVSTSHARATKGSGGAGLEEHLAIAEGGPRDVGPLPGNRPAANGDVAVEAGAAQGKETTTTESAARGRSDMGAEDSGSAQTDDASGPSAIPPSAGSAASAAGGAGGGPFRFFQSFDGQKAFLHPLDMRQLLDDSEKGLPLPQRIDAQVLEVETVKLTPELRRRLPFLGHLPIHCDVSFLEVDMAGFVSEGTTHKFREEIQKRARKRRGRAAQEARAAREEARLEQDRANRIAAMRAFTVDLQGPTPGGPDSPPRHPPPSASASAHTANQGPGSPESGGNDPGSSAAGAAAARGARGDANSSSPSSCAGLEGKGATGGWGAGGQGAAGWSFARVTAMNGHFPTLKPSAEEASGGPRATNSAQLSAGAWGGGATKERNIAGGAGAWGARVSGPSGGTEDAVEERSLAAGEGSATNGKKKSRRGKAVPLFSNAGVRGGAR